MSAQTFIGLLAGWFALYLVVGTAAIRRASRARKPEAAQTTRGTES